MFWSYGHFPAVTLFPNPEAFFHSQPVAILAAVEERGGLLGRNVEAPVGCIWQAPLLASEWPSRAPGGVYTCLSQDSEENLAGVPKGFWGTWEVIREAEMKTLS